MSLAPADVEIHGSVFQAGWIVLLNVALFVVLAAVALIRGLTGLGPGEAYLARLGALVALAPVGWFAMVNWRRLRRSSGIVLRLNAGGIHDRRLSGQPIPWSEVISLREWQVEGQRFVGISLTARGEAMVRPSAQKIRRVSARLGYDFHAIESRGLQTNHTALLKVAEAGYAAWRGRSAT